MHYHELNNIYGSTDKEKTAWKLEYMYKEKKQKGHLQVIAGRSAFLAEENICVITITSIVFNCYFGTSRQSNG